ncbi:hypothetical protein PG984_008982 [Apiospora sp. TS-2023a]
MADPNNNNDSHSIYFDAFESIETDAAARGSGDEKPSGASSGCSGPETGEHEVQVNIMNQRQGTSSTSTLEHLPAELRSQILSSIPDLPSIRSLVRASPVLHAQYLCYRASILCSCMERELDGFVLDAYALLTPRVRYIGSPRTDEKIKYFLEGYGGWISGSKPYLSVSEMHPSSLRWIAAYHLSVARPLAQRYARWANANLTLADLEFSLAATSPPQGVKRSPKGSWDDERIEAGVSDVTLSRSEEIRIFRALYRYDTFYHLFGQNRGIRMSTEFLRYNINEMFCGLFDPWEVEAIGTVDLFVREKYHKIFTEVTWDLSDENPRFHQDGIFDPSDSFNLEGEYDLARGLELTSKLLAVKGHENLVAKMERSLTHSDEMDYRLNQVLSFVAQADRRDELPSFPAAREEAEQRRDPLEFAGDSIPPDGPPLGWCLLWNKRYANIYGQLVPKPFRRTGYVIWDAGRWDAMSCDLRKLIAKIWADDPKTVEWVQATCDWSWSPVD